MCPKVAVYIQYILQIFIFELGFTIYLTNIYF